MTDKKKTCISAEISGKTLSLLHFNESLTKDEAGILKWNVIGNPELTSTGAKFGSGIKFAGNDSNLQYIYSDPFNFGGEDFTIDCWCSANPRGQYADPCYVFLVSATWEPLTNKGIYNPTSSNDWYILFYEIYSGGVACCAYSATCNNNTSDVYMRSKGLVKSQSVNQVSHQAIVYSQTDKTAKWYTDGSLIHTQTNVTTPRRPMYIMLGFGFKASNSRGPMNLNTGVVSELRISKCQRYITNFTPSTSRYDID